MKPSPRREFAVLFGAMFALLGCSSPTPSVPPPTAPVDAHLEISCAPEVQRDFDQALTLLHSFEYPETTLRFSEILAADPDCAMAYWGAAMSVWHPLWAPPRQADLERGAALLQRSEGLPTTAREAAYIDALRSFFSSIDPATHRQRAGEFERHMAAVYEDHLDDPEAATFYALALLASADPRDKTYAHQFKAAGLLNWVGRSQPTHPGVLHYLIHAYDYPGLAHLALDAAKTYASAAPDSAHAQHMPTHIFTRLGLWERSLASNHEAARSAAEYTERAGLPGHYDEGIHTMDYLMYAMLQTARDDEARELLARLEGIEKTDVESFKVAFTYAASPARYALERREWEEASRLPLTHPDFAWEDFPWARSIHHFARGIGAARSGRLDAAGQELETIRALLAQLPETTPPYWLAEVMVHAETVESWILRARGRDAEALALAAAAADREDAVDKHPVTPGEPIPARELYADMLMETGDSAQALAQYETVLAASPNRLNALLGAARAAREAGDVSLADHYQQIARDQTIAGNQERLSAGLR